MSSTHGNIKHTITPYILYNKMSPNCTYSNMALSSQSPMPPLLNEDRNLSNMSDMPNTPDIPEQDVKLLGHFGYRYPYWGYHGYGYGYGYNRLPFYGCYPYRNCWRWPWYF